MTGMAKRDKTEREAKRSYYATLFILFLIGLVLGWVLHPLFFQ